jgi:hypothetical protein
MRCLEHDPNTVEPTPVALQPHPEARATHSDLVLRSDPQDRVSKDEAGNAVLAAILRDARYAASSG